MVSDISKRENTLRPMARHTADEFVFAAKTLHETVLDSHLFPERAARADWFRPRTHANNVHSTDGCDDSSSGNSNYTGLEPVKNMLTDQVVDTTAYFATPPTLHSSVVSSIHHSGADGHIKALERDDTTVDMSESSSSLPTISPHSKEYPMEAVPYDYSCAPTKVDQKILAKQLAKDYSPVPSIQEKDIDYGAILGVGGFCEVRLATLKKDKCNDQSPQFYAMKYLSPTKCVRKVAASTSKGRTQSKRRNKQFERGIADLAIEARFLTLLSHDNIISMHYVSGGSLEEQFNCNGMDNLDHQFGLIMLIDPLFETLAKRIDETYIPQVFLRSDEDNIASGAVTQLPHSSKRSSLAWWKQLTTNMKTDSLLPFDSWKVQLSQRLEDLIGIASALRYLHDDCCVIFRDLKPDNIGFYRKPHPKCSCGKRSSSASTSTNMSSFSCTCYTEVPKLFDFGLAKELKPKLFKAHPHHERDYTVDTYKLTPRSGSKRYMAPEVAFSTPYNEKADVYSFGILLYQVASLVIPFEGYTMCRHEKEVLCEGDRPNICIPNNNRALNKIRKSSDMTHVEWLDQNDLARMKHLEACTKCVWTKELKCLMEECWHDDMGLRPSMADVVQRLECCI